MIGFCIDSNSQISDELVERYGVEVVPLTVVVDGEELLEGVTITADDFYRRFSDGTAPSVSTAAASPGQFLAAYDALVARGATEILSVHIGSAISATLSSARLAASEAPVPVRLVDTGTASFGIACALWEAAESVAKGATLDEAAAVAEAVGSRVGNVFVVRALDLARAGGRLESGTTVAEGIPVLTLADGRMSPIGSATSVDEAADLMAAHVRAAGLGLRVGIGIADGAATLLWTALEERLVEADEVLDVVRYRIGPSVGVHTGPGTAGAVYYPSL